MKHFTPEELKPSELTLHLLRTIAHNFPIANMTHEERSLSWN